MGCDWEIPDQVGDGDDLKLEGRKKLKKEINLKFRKTYIKKKKNLHPAV